LKLLDYVPGILGRRLAARRDAYEGLYVDPDGYVTEAATANVFAWNGRRLITPPLANILPGVTRRLVIELAAAEGLQVVERRLKATELLAAREAFLTSSTAEVVPIVAIDARRVGDGAVGPQVRRLQTLYRQLVDKMMA
jgi:branched-subunit amino acid aminotransferase/4-amino-4-deoxychorismate lyase